MRVRAFIHTRTRIAVGFLWIARVSARARGAPSPLPARPRRRYNAAPVRGAVGIVIGIVVLSWASCALAQEPPASAEPTPMPFTVALRPSQVDAAVRPRLGKIKSCYRDAAKSDPKLFGVVGVGMHVSPEGQVGDRWITVSTLGSEKLDECILQAFAGLTFPAPGGNGAVVRYGVSLTQKSSPPEPAKVQEESYTRSLRDQP